MIILILIISLVLTFYFYFTRNHGYWAKRSVKHEKPIPLFGTHFRNFFAYENITDITAKLYKKYYNEQFFGYYRGNTPELYVKDPEMVRHVLSQDFTSFYARGLGRDPKVEPLLLSIFHVEGDTWKLLRQRMTPAFTGRKLKSMFPLIIKCAEKFQKIVDKETEKEESNVKELMGRFTTEFIGACGFGIEMDSINNEKSHFRDLVDIIVHQSRYFVLAVALKELVPELTHSLSGSNKFLEDSMTDLFIRLKEQRNNKPIGRNDFIDLLLELQALGQIEGNSIERTDSDGTPVKVNMELDLKCMVAHLFVFFAAGSETSSLPSSYLLYQLAYNPEIQVKVQEDIDNALAKYDNKLCYDAIAEMKYLDMAFKEAMRLLPPLGVLNRDCTRKFTFPGTNLTIDPGVKIVIPVQCLQIDEKYYDDPHQFIPERFSPEEVVKRHKFVYLPFGEGPRACIGERMGRMQSLAGVAALLHKFSFEPSVSTKKHLTFDPWINIIQSIVGGIPLKITKRKMKAF